jgi:serine/threonine protein kinase
MSEEPSRYSELLCILVREITDGWITVNGESVNISVSVLTELTRRQPQESTGPMDESDFHFPREHIGCEADLQNSDEVKKFVEIAGIDTSDSHCKVPLYCHLHETESGASQQACTSKPDISGFDGIPALVELKADDAKFMELLLQGTRRMYAKLYGQQCYCRANVLAITPSHSVLLEMTSTFSDGNHVFGVSFTLVRMIDCYRIWKHVNSLPLSDFARPDTYMLVKAVQSVDKNAKFLMYGCNLIVSANPDVIIYEVVVPRYEDRAFVLNPSCRSFIVKIHTSNVKFARETAVMKKITGITSQYFVTSGDYNGVQHVFGAFGSGFIEKMKIERTGSLLHSTKTAAILHGDVIEGGFIVMMKGYHFCSNSEYVSFTTNHGDKFCEKSSFSSDFSNFTFAKVKGILRCMSELHEKGVCHADIRANNVMYFPSMQRYSLIDFDNSCKVGTDQVLTAGGERRKLLNYILPRGAAPNDVAVVTWTKEIDYWMLLAFVGDKFDFALSQSMMSFGLKAAPNM